jgi:putative acetyltransferase
MKGHRQAVLLERILSEARQMGFSQVSLETGSAEFFVPAYRLYAKFGFVRCGPFADYQEDPHSVFMTRPL